MSSLQTQIARFRDCAATLAEVTGSAVTAAEGALGIGISCFDTNQDFVTLARAITFLLLYGDDSPERMQSEDTFIEATKKPDCMAALFSDNPAAFQITLERLQFHTTILAAIEGPYKRLIGAIAEDDTRSLVSLIQTSIIRQAADHITTTTKGADSPE